MYLLDTHTLLWFLYDSDDISEKAKMLIEEADEVYVSIASLWEIAIKQGIGKLKNQDSITKIAEVCRKKDLRIIGITPEQLEALKQLPMIHRDPFDRLLIAQAFTNNLILITKDGNITKYSCIKTKW